MKILLSVILLLSTGCGTITNCLGKQQATFLGMPWDDPCRKPSTKIGYTSCTTTAWTPTYSTTSCNTF